MLAARPRPGPGQGRSLTRARARTLALTRALARRLTRGLGAVLALGLMAVAGCSPAASDPRDHTSASPHPSALPSDGASAGPPVSSSPDGSASAAACPVTVGAQLRERTTVGKSGLVTVLPGTLPCASVGLWISRFTLDSDPTLDPAPQFGARYTGARQLAVRIPPVTGRCAAAAVFFTVDADDASDGTAASRAADDVRDQLAAWPAASTGVVPGGGILRGRASPVLAGTVVGDPAACSPGESVSSPVAAAGDCWTALPDAGASPSPSATAAAVADGATRFRRTTCGEAHTHEVYWAASLTTAQYLAEGRSAGLAAAAWARKRADSECARRSTDLDLAHDVTRGDIFLEFLWPATLSYPPTGPTGWSKAQIVCLARWQDGRASNRHLLHR